jgi:thiamine-phosphate pyrophosphorylase
MLRYAITNRAMFPGDETRKQEELLRHTFHWVRDGFDFIQLREKDLPDAALASLADEILEAIGSTRSHTRLLINSRPGIAIATRAHGVHLTAAPDEMTPAQVRSLYASAGLPAPIVSVSCHSLDEVNRGHDNKADVILFAPVFGKNLDGGEAVPGKGLDQLRKACAAAEPIPVFALGGVTRENVPSCLSAGAAGVAGIRLFHGY